MTAEVLKQQPSKLSEMICIATCFQFNRYKSVNGPTIPSSKVLDTPGMGLWGRRLWEQGVRSFPEAIASQRQGTLVDAEPGGHRVCCCAPAAHLRLAVFCCSPYIQPLHTATAKVFGLQHKTTLMKNKGHFLNLFYRKCSKIQPRCSLAPAPVLKYLKFLPISHSPLRSVLQVQTSGKSVSLTIE